MIHHDWMAIFMSKIYVCSNAKDKVHSSQKHELSID